jgi:hypothetical protein
MASFPDIIVTSPDSPRVLIAIETKIAQKLSKDAVRQLQHYMVKMSCPLGLLVSPEELYIYRNRYTGSDENAIDEIGHYRLGNAFQGFVGRSPEQSPAKAYLFESYVQRWLEHLPKSDEIERLPADLKEALETHIVPALESGIVRAAGPREIRSGF